MNLFLIGHSCAKDMHFDNIHNFKEIIEAANIIYHTIYTYKGQSMYNPQTKEFTAGLGEYTVESFNENKKEMIIKASSPFPAKSDEGMFYGLFEKNKPANIKTFNIKLDNTKERRSNGADSCTYIVTW